METARFYELFVDSVLNVGFLGTSGPSSTILMELVKSAAKIGSMAHEKVAVRAGGKSHSYFQLLTSALQISMCFQESQNHHTDSAFNGTESGCGCPPKQVIRGQGHLNGARVGIVAKPSAEFISSVLATWLSGGVAVPLALSYPEAELFHVMNDSEVSVLLSPEDHQIVMESVAAKCSAKFMLIPPVPSISCDKVLPTESTAGNVSQLANLWGEIESTNMIEGENPALIVYTSGTTGKPKGVVHTHNGIISQVQILTEAWGYTSADQFLNCLPLHHVHGLFNALFAPLYAGSVVEFMPKFTVRGIWQRWRESYPQDGNRANDAITVFTGVPTMYTRLLQGYDALDSELQLASASAARQLRLMMCGSSALPYPVMQQWENITGHRLLERYGMTEFVMALSNPLRGVRKGGTVGKPLPHVQVKILAEAGSGTADVGELCVKSPSLFKEYWKQPEVTKESFVDGGYFKTGDTVKVDEDGYYIILGRTSADIMKVGGYKLSALEIEAVLLEHPAVSECCVLGLPDLDYGEAVCAIIVPAADAKTKENGEFMPAITLKELQSWAKDKLAPYKLPTRLFLWSSLPRNAMGKVNKKELKKRLSDEC
ncbi:probable CoA ligase CCL8 isoform X2 [Nymphaea colorata]|uniref:probable CoA ligase CCL8 isoform X2 n=1 Tax=Nymphaea colorata TaxID=210225 RepID=UPI00129DF81A|nr:probable CoA ligase CCL8 isoform X2 [Nymphaea colorata]